MAVRLCLPVVAVRSRSTHGGAVRQSGNHPAVRRCHEQDPPGVSQDDVGGGCRGRADRARRGSGAMRQGSLQIKNFNPKMGYRRLGKTEIMISEVSLGGHGSQGLQNRVDVLTRAAELGVNYFDTNIVEECAEYGKALRGRRDHWTIGFASWPQKITTEYEDQLSRDGMIRQIEARLKDYQTDVLDIWRPVGATWGKGQTKIPTMLMVSRKTLDLVVEAFEMVHRQGKVRFLGISAHNPKVFRRVLNDYPQFSVIIFPYLFLTKPFGGDSLLALAKTKDVGVIGLKPFGAGTTFGIKPREIKGDVDSRALRPAEEDAGRTPIVGGHSRGQHAGPTRRKRQGIVPSEIDR